ncbi:MAG: hypothetical protein L3K14_04745 [Thermoplasmata archaeon]|nr:hypothetical protein [Thermoplasmata archaeon]
MTCPTSVQVSVSGTLNHSAVKGQGTLNVDCDTGTKSGTINYTSPPPPGSPGGDSMPIGTSRCFVGAKQVGRGEFVGPLDLLGPAFVSVRSSIVGRHGVVSLSETARLVKGVLHSELTVAGHVKTPRLRGAGPLRERITVSEGGTLISEGRYSLVTKGGRSIPVRYTHFYRSLRPNRRLFRQMAGQVFLLQATVSTRRRGKTLVCHTESTLRRLRGPGGTRRIKRSD